MNLLPIIDILNARDGIGPNQASIIFKRCAALHYVIYQVSRNRSDEITKLLEDNYLKFMFQSAQNDINNFGIAQDQILEYTNKILLPYAEHYTKLINKNYLETGNYLGDEFLGADMATCADIIEILK